MLLSIAYPALVQHCESVLRGFASQTELPSGMIRNGTVSSFDTTCQIATTVICGSVIELLSSEP